MGMQIDGLDEFERKLNDRRVMDELESAMQQTVEFTKEVVVDAVENSGRHLQALFPTSLY